MDNKPLVLLCLALGGMLFLGAEPNNSNVRFNGTYRPHPRTNPGVTDAGYLVITTPAGEWICDRTDVMSVSAHTYQIDGGMRVWEVTIAERSSMIVKYYYTEPLVVEPERAGAPSDEESGGKLDTLKGESTKTKTPKARKEETGLLVPVRKTYPDTTHAHVVEFRIEKLDRLDEIYAYLTLMVYGWSPKIERPEASRKLRVHEELPKWHDWDYTEKQRNP